MKTKTSAIEREPIKLTVEQLLKACEENKYLLVRNSSVLQIGVNTAVALLAFKSFPFDEHSETRWVSYKPCGFSEYLSFKTPFKN